MAGLPQPTEIPRLIAAPSANLHLRNASDDRWQFSRRPRVLARAAPRADPGNLRWSARRTLFSRSTNALRQPQSPPRRDERRARSGHTWAKPWPKSFPTSFPYVEPFIRRALQGEPVLGVERQKPEPEGTGERQTVLLSYQPARDEAGEVLGVSVAVMDITEPKRTEEALRESVSHFRHLLELGPHVPWVLNEKGEVIEASSRWEDFTGQPLSEAIGTDGSPCCIRTMSATTKNAIRLCLATGEPIDVYYRVRKNGGDWSLMRSRGSPRFDPSGKIIGVYGVVEEAALERSSRKEWQSFTTQ